MMQGSSERDVSFWVWFIGDRDNKPGCHCILNIWILKHLLIGAILLNIIPISIKDASTTVLLPLAGIFIGISCAWMGNAHNLLQSKEIRDLSEYREGGLKSYIFVYQTSVLVIISALVAWGMAGLGVYDYVCPIHRFPECNIVIQLLLYSLLSLAISECWSIVLGTQLMLLYQMKIRAFYEFKEDQSDTNKKDNEND